jgi:PII-like signaling protein
VNEDSLKLTSYFGERQRAGGRFAADALLDAYGRSGVAASILLRGTEGFGAKHRLRTDRSLSLSEDLPLVAIAIDTRPVIESLHDEVRRLTGAGLVTLEGARLLTGDIAPATELAPGPSGDATKLTVYLGRQERAGRGPAFLAVCDLLHRRGIAGATALLGVDGTAWGERRRAAFFGGNADVPMMVIAIGPAERITRVLPELGGLLRRPLLTLERVHVCKRDGQRLGTPGDLAGADASGQPLWHKLMVYTSEAALHDGQPVHRAIVRRLRTAGIAGATTLRGVWGFHGDHAPHGDRLLQFGRRVPAVTTVIDAPEKIATAFGFVDELTSERGLVSCETVPAAGSGPWSPPAGHRPGRGTGAGPSPSAPRGR